MRPQHGLAETSLWVLVPTLLTITAVVSGAHITDGAKWRGLVVAAELKCIDYNPVNLRHSDVEQKIADNLDGWWSAYDGTAFANQECAIVQVQWPNWKTGPIHRFCRLGGKESFVHSAPN